MTLSFSFFDTRFKTNTCKRTQWHQKVFQTHTAKHHRHPHLYHSDTRMGARPLAEPPLDQPDLHCTHPFSHGKAHCYYATLALCRSSSLHPTSPTSHTTSKDAHLQGQPEPPTVRDNLTGSREQPGRAGSKGDPEQRKQRERKRLRTAWMSAERDVKFKGMIWNSSLVDLKRQPCFISF